MKQIVHYARLHYNFLRTYGAKTTYKLNRQMHRTKSRFDKELLGTYEKTSIQSLAKEKRSNRAFVFGSGYSLHDISVEEWSDISDHVTIGFNGFVFQKWIPTDFHVIRGWAEGAGPATDWEAVTESFSELVIDNPHYQKTKFIVQHDLTALFAHELIQRNKLPGGAQILPYKTNRVDSLPTRDFSRGLVHANGTLCDAIHFAFCLGCTEIVLVGVDLYDSRYFWIEPTQTFFVNPETGEREIKEYTDRGSRYDETHSTAINGIIETMATWNEEFKSHGAELFVYNPRSLLASKLKVFDRRDNT